jgi:hypothetical protein
MCGPGPRRAKVTGLSLRPLEALACLAYLRFGGAPGPCPAPRAALAGRGGQSPCTGRLTLARKPSGFCERSGFGISRDGVKRLRNAFQGAFAEAPPVRVRESTRSLRETVDRRSLGLSRSAQVMRARISSRNVLVRRAQTLACRQQVARILQLGAHDLVDSPGSDRRLQEPRHPVRRPALSPRTKLGGERIAGGRELFERQSVEGVDLLWQGLRSAGCGVGGFVALRD